MFRRGFVRNERGGLWALPLLLAVLALGLSLFPAAGETLQWMRAAPLNGLRWFTCHFVHWSWSHALWDAVVFGFLGAWVYAVSPRGFYWTTGLAAVAIPAGVWLGLPLATYRGLSGLDSALFGYLAGILLAEARREKDTREAWLVGTFLAAFAAKTAYESIVRQPFFVPNNGLMVPVPLAHAVGGAIGFTAALWEDAWSYWFMRRKSHVQNQAI